MTGPLTLLAAESLLRERERQIARAERIARLNPDNYEVRPDRREVLAVVVGWMRQTMLRLGRSSTAPRCCPEAA